MRLSALIVLIPLAACSVAEQKHPYAEANALMRKEILARIAEIPFQQNQELMNNLMWLETKAGELAIPDLLDALNESESKVRSSSAWVLGRIRDRRVLPHLRPLAADEDPAVRFEAARSLVMMGDLKFAPILIEGLDSERTPVRYSCHMALRDATHRDFLYDHLEDNVDTRRQAVLRWRQWWSEQSGDPWFAGKYAKEFGLGDTGDQNEQGLPSVPMTEIKNDSGANEERGTTLDPDSQPPETQPGRNPPPSAVRKPPEMTSTEPGLSEPRATRGRPNRKASAAPETEGERLLRELFGGKSGAASKNDKDGTEPDGAKGGVPAPAPAPGGTGTPGETGTKNK